MSLRSSVQLISALVILAAWALGPAHAGTISLAWDPVTHDDLVGYRLGYGTSPTDLSQTLDVGLTTQATLTGLTDCTTYYISIRARAGDGSLSPDPSNVVSGWSRPVVSSAAPTQVEQGKQAQITVQGANFQSGASAQLSGTGVTVDGVSISTCGELVLDVSADADAPIGARDVTVVNPDQSFGIGAALFSVIADTTAPSISDVSAGSPGATAATITWTTDELADSQVFYREVGQPSYQSTAIDSALVTAHSVDIVGLTPETEYEYYVRSADAFDNASTANGPTTFTTPVSTYSYLRIEGESVAVTAPLQSATDAEAFASECVALAAGTPKGNPANPAGTWDYGFHVPNAGTWYVWLRVYGASNTSDEWFEAVDGGSLVAVEASQDGVWEWVAGRSYDLSAGLHTFTLGGYEAEARADRILITDDPTFVPTEQPGSDGTPPAPAIDFSATAGDAMVALAWTNPGTADLARIVVVYRTDGRAPSNPFDGFTLVDRAASPIAMETFDHTGLSNGQTYHYSVFAIDDEDNVADPVTAQATPQQTVVPLPQVQNLRRTDVLGN